MLTKAELAEIKARTDAATEGPFHQDRYEHGGGRMAHITPETDGRKLVLDAFHLNDREFYFHARDDIPALLAHIEELEAKAKQVRDEALEDALSVCWNVRGDANPRDQHCNCLGLATERIRALLATEAGGGE